MIRIVPVFVVVALLGVAACGQSSEDVSAKDPGQQSSASVSTGEPDGGQVGDFCTLNAELARLFGELAHRSGADAEATWLNIEVVVDLLKDEAPLNLAPDVAAGASYYEALGDALKAADYDDAVAIVESVPQDPELATAESRIDEYLDANC